MTLCKRSTTFSFTQQPTLTFKAEETRKKANAVFFSVIMVLSMVAIGFAGFAGTAAAQPLDESLDVEITQPEDEATVDQTDGDLTINIDITNTEETALEEENGYDLVWDFDEGADTRTEGDVTVDAADGETDGTATVTFEDVDASGIPDGEYTHTATLLDGDSEEVATDSNSITFESVGTITGTVEDGDESAIEGATVSVDGAELSATTGEDGIYTIEDAPSGEHDLTASAAGFESDTQTGVSVTAGETTSEVDFTLTAIEEGDPLPESDLNYDPDRPWQGQDVEASGSLIQDDGDDITEYDLYRVTSQEDGSVESATFVEQVTTDAGDEPVVIETDDLDAGDYFLRDGAGPLPRNPSMDNTFEVRIQDLDTDFDDDTVADAGGDAFTDFEIDSNRGTWTQNVSADGDLDDEELFGIFADSDEFDDADENRVSFSDIQSANEDGDAFQDIDGVDEGPYGDFNVFLYDEDEDDADEKIGFYRVSDKEEEMPC